MALWFLQKSRKKKIHSFNLCLIQAPLPAFTLKTGAGDVMGTYCHLLAGMTKAFIGAFMSFRVSSCLVQAGVFVYCALKKGYKAKEEAWWKKKTKQRISATSCYSTYSTCVSIHSWLRRLMYKKARSLWAACNSQYDFYNGHNGGQDHLLLAGGEVCILLQLKRKTSRCLQRAVMWLWEWWIHGEWVSQAGGSILLSGAGGGSVIEVN